MGEADAGELDIYTPRQASNRVIFKDFFVWFVIGDDVLLFGNHFKDGDGIEEKLSKFYLGLYRGLRNVSVFASAVILCCLNVLVV